MAELMRMLNEKELENSKLQRRVKDLEERYKLSDKKIYGSKSQKSKKKEGGKAI